MTSFRFDIFSLLTAAGLAVGTAIAAALFILPSGNRKANRVFGLFLVLNSGSIFSLGLSTLTNLYLYIPHVIRTGFLFQLLLGPCLYLYFRFLLETEYRLKPSDSGHLVLPVAYFIWHAPFYFSSAENKIRFIQDWFYSNIHINARIDGILLPIPFILQFTVYLILIFWKIRFYHIGLTKLYSDTSMRRVNWGWFMIIGWSGFFLVSVSVFVLWCSGFISLWMLAKILLLTITMFILVLAFNALRQPDINENIDSRKLMNGKSPLRNSGFTSMNEDVEAQEYSRLISHMTSREYWRDPELTLDLLARKMGLSRGDLSRLINTRSGCNFHDFVNGYRINKVLRILVERPDRNILDTAVSAGFSNKSTFYKLFREHTGRTPTEFIKTYRG